MARGKARTQVPELTPEEQAKRDLEIRRHDYKELRRIGALRYETTMIVHGMLEKVAIRGGKIRMCQGGGINLDVERAWAVSANISIDFNREGRLINPDNDREQIVTCKPEVHVNWSCTQRSVASAVAAIVLYREVTELAAEIESFLTERPIIHIMQL